MGGVRAIDDPRRFKDAEEEEEEERVTASANRGGDAVVEDLDGAFAEGTVYRKRVEQPSSEEAWYAGYIREMEGLKSMDDDDAPRTGSGRVNARVDVVGKRAVRVMSSRARGRARWMDGEAWMGEMKARAAERRGRRRRRRRRRRPGREFGARARDEVSWWVVCVPLMILACFKTRKRRRRRSKCCLLYTSPSPRDATLSRMPSSA